MNDLPANLPEAETLYEGRFLRLRREGRWEYCERTNSRGAGFIIGLTPRRELLLVEQYRVPLHARTIELPAGLIGDEEHCSDESIEACAIRELEEETGWRGEDARIVLTGPIAAGMTSEILYLVQVEDLKQVHAGGGVAGEDIVVHRVPLARIDAWLQQKADDGLMIEPRIYVALHLLARTRSRARPAAKRTRRGGR